MKSLPTCHFAPDAPPSPLHSIGGAPNSPGGPSPSSPPPAERPDSPGRTPSYLTWGSRVKAGCSDRINLVPSLIRYHRFDVTIFCQRGESKSGICEVLLGHACLGRLLVIVQMVFVVFHPDNSVPTPVSPLHALCGNSSLRTQCEHPCPANTRCSDRINLVLLCSQDTGGYVCTRSTTSSMS